MEASGYKHSSTSGTPKLKVERKFIEKKRRCQMKTLYFNLCSLLPPNHNSKEGLPLPDKIDEAVKYINTLKLKLEKYKENNNEKFLGITTTQDHNITKPFASHFEIHQIGPDLDIVLVNGLHNYFSFNQIMRLLHQQSGVEVVQANFSNSANSVFHVLHQKFGRRYETTANISRRLKDLIHGTSTNDIDISDFEILEF